FSFFFLRGRAREEEEQMSAGAATAGVATSVTRQLMDAELASLRIRRYRRAGSTAADGHFSAAATAASAQQLLASGELAMKRAAGEAQQLRCTFQLFDVDESGFVPMRDAPLLLRAA